MLVYYAMGGGVGHLVRARAFLATLQYAGRVTVVTSSALALDRRIHRGLDVSVVPLALDRKPDAFRDWLFGELGRVGADCLCVDTFPAGILGELDSLPQGLALWHVARRLRWDAYVPLLRAPSLQFQRSYCVEPLNSDQQAFLERHSDSIAHLELRDPPPPEAPSPIAGPYWLVAHSGPHDEVSNLVAQALEMRSIEGSPAQICVATQCTPRFEHPDVRTLDVFPAEPYFAGADRIVTAAGFNVIRQTRAHRHKQTIVPMPRRFDDQFERARRARAQH